MYKCKTDSKPRKGKVLSKALQNMNDYLGLKRSELAAIIGTSPASLSRLFSGNHEMNIHKKEAELALILLRLYRSLDTLLGGNTKQIQDWLRSPNKHLNGIPIELIQSVEGLIVVTTYLDAMRGKL
ncbi:MAG: antitoxin Xre/MbcA/ParS toxin-binding domain-containing protein [Gammaproteobacteria bacterium]